MTVRNPQHQCRTSVSQRLLYRQTELHNALPNAFQQQRFSFEAKLPLGPCSGSPGRTHLPRHRAAPRPSALPGRRFRPPPSLPPRACLPAGGYAQLIEFSFRLLTR